MFERFTESAIKVIMLAQEESRRLGHNFVGTEQILLGLIGEEKGIAAKVLIAHDLTVATARFEVEKIIGRGNGIVSIEIPFTPRAKRVLELSLKQANTLGDDYVSTQHLLLGLLRECGGVGIRVLENLKVNRERLRVDVLKSIGKTGLNAPDAPVVPTDTADMRSSYEYSWYEPGAITTISRAWGIAETLGVETITAAHLCLALLREMEIIRFFQNSGSLDLSAVRHHLVNGLLSGSASPRESMNFSQDALDILTNAWNITVAEKLVGVTKEALLLGALKQDNGILVQALRATNADPSGIEESIKEAFLASHSADSSDKVSAEHPLSAATFRAHDWSAGGWFITLVVSALLIYAIYLTDHEKFVLMAPVLLLICFVIFAVLLFRKAVLK
jgi:ATP-dependent Clp protease ATP-binding subunit ClpA